VACGQFHSMGILSVLIVLTCIVNFNKIVLTHDHNVYCFGRNNFGQTAIERDSESILKPRLVKALVGHKIVQVYAM
jgi:alpha-tubulin suppressor-like RCC1 family protein